MGKEAANRKSKKQKMGRIRIDDELPWAGHKIK